jgi:hypothetical protein
MKALHVTHNTSGGGQLFLHMHHEIEWALSMQQYVASGAIAAVIRTVLAAVCRSIYSGLEYIRPWLIRPPP